MEGKIERLILLVSERPEIYDLSNKHYSNLIRKENIWREIAKELNESRKYLLKYVYFCKIRSCNYNILCTGLFKYLREL